MSAIYFENGEHNSDPLAIWYSVNIKRSTRPTRSKQQTNSGRSLSLFMTPKQSITHHSLHTYINTRIHCTVLYTVSQKISPTFLAVTRESISRFS